MSAWRRGRLARGARGYTAVEVMLAMTVLLISTAGVMAMQKGAVQGNLDARRLDIANSIARTWLDRLSTDATAWNSNTPTLGATQWLGALSTAYTVPAYGATGAGSPGLLSPAFDIMGRDLPAADPTMVFCVEVKLDTLAVDSGANPTVVRGTVLVFWPKNLLGGGLPTLGCAAGAVLDPAVVEAATPGTYHMLYAAEALRRSS